jgi:hypothetical protein
MFVSEKIASLGTSCWKFEHTNMHSKVIEMQV